MRHSHIVVIGVPLDLGAGRRGVDMGPSAVRVANLDGKLHELGYEVEDLGNVAVVQRESQSEGPAQAKYLPQITDTCTRLAEMTGDVLRAGKFPIVLGGDHSIAVGTVSGVSQHLRQSGQKLGMIWIDAHTDMNTPDSSPSGNVHGMPLACCIGLGPQPLTDIFGFSPKVSPANVALVGIRSVDEKERRNVQRSGRSRLYHARYRRARAASGDGGSHRIMLLPEPQDFMCRSTWMRWIRTRRPASARPCKAASPTAKRIWPWKCCATPAG